MTFLIVAQQNEPLDSLSPVEVQRGEGRGKRGLCVRVTEKDWVRKRRAMYHFQSNKLPVLTDSTHMPVFRALRWVEDERAKEGGGRNM